MRAFPLYGTQVIVQSDQTNDVKLMLHVYTERETDMYVVLDALWSSVTVTAGKLFAVCHY